MAPIGAALLPVRSLGHGLNPGASHRQPLLTGDEILAAGSRRRENHEAEKRRSQNRPGIENVHVIRRKRQGR